MNYLIVNSTAFEGYLFSA